MLLEKQLRSNLLVEMHVIMAQAIQEHFTLLPEDQRTWHCPALSGKVLDAFCLSHYSETD